MYGVDETRNPLYEIPEPMPTVDTPLDELLGTIAEFTEWAIANKESMIFTRNKAVNADSPAERRKNRALLKQALDAISTNESMELV